MTARSRSFSVGEYWSSLAYGDQGMEYNQDFHRQQLVDWVNQSEGKSTAFDFTTKGILQEAVNGQLWRMIDLNGKAPGMIGWLPAQAVTFVDNHDTGSTQGHWPFPSDKVMQGYAYILTHPGVPCIFYDHYFDWGLKKEIDALIQARKVNKIRADSEIEIIRAEADLYLAKIANKLIVKLGSRADLGDLTPDADWKLACFGNDYCVWENAMDWA